MVRVAVDLREDLGDGVADEKREGRLGAHAQLPVNVGRIHGGRWREGDEDDAEEMTGGGERMNQETSGSRVEGRGARV